MSNNCLVTKLKGTVQNDNLPIYGKVFCDWAGFAGNENSTSSLCIGVPANAPGSVTLSAKKEFHPDDISSPAVTSLTLSPGGKRTVIFENSVIGSSPISELVEISGAYNLERLATYSWSSITIRNTGKNRVNAYLKYNPIKVFGEYVDIDNSGSSDLHVSEDTSNVKYLVLSANNDNSVVVRRSLNYIFDMPINSEIDVIQSVSIGGIYYSPKLNVNMIKDTSIKCLFGHGRLIGTTANLPTTLLIIEDFINTGMFTGDLVDFVVNARTNGRTSGYLLFGGDYTFVSAAVTFQGTPISQLTIPIVSYGNPYSHQYKVLKWTANTIEWSDTYPYDVDILARITPFWYEEGMYDNIGE